MRRLPTRRLTLAFGALAAVGALLASCAPPAAPSGPPAAPTLTRTVLVGGLDHPWDLAFLPDGNMLYTQRSGTISVYVAGTGATQVIQGPPTDFVNEQYQAGMLGIAVDPDFAANRYVYTYMTSKAGNPSNPPRTVTDAVTTAGGTTFTSATAAFTPADTHKAVVGAGIPGGTFIRNVLDPTTVELAKAATATASGVTASIETHDNRVIRWVLAGDDLSLVRDADIVTGIPYGTEAGIGHNGGRLRFGPDGALWITTGDGDLGTNAQNGASLGGKTLRVTRDGAPAAGNPELWGLDPRVFDFGHRNPEGIAFQPGTGQAYGIEHGPDRDDEVNKLVPGGNYGWNPVPLPYTQSVPMTNLDLFPNAITATWSSGFPTVAPSGATFLGGAQWKNWDGALVLATLKDERLLTLFFDGAQHVTSVDDQTFATLGIRLRSAVEGPDGNLYITTDGGSPNGEIWKVVPS